MVSEQKHGIDWAASISCRTGVVLGIGIGLATVVLARFSFIWSALIVVGLSVLVGSLAARDPKTYWLVIFALVLPLEIKKMLVDSSFVMEFVKDYGFPSGELPGPVLYLSDLPLLVLFALWTFDVLVHRHQVRFPKAHWLALGLLAWSALSIINARDLASAFFDLCRGAKFYLMYVLAYNTLDRPERVRWVVIALLAGMVLQGVVCLSQFASQEVGRLFTTLLGKKDLYSTDLKNTIEGVMRISEGGLAGKRASGTVGPLNAQAYYFEQLLPMACLLCLVARQRIERRLALVATVLGVLGLLVTFSRGGLVGLFFGIVSLFVLAWWRNIVPRRQLASFGLLGLLLLVSALPLVTRYFTSRPEGATARFHLMGVGLQMVADHPVLGVGLNNHMQAKHDYDSREYAIQMATHNHFVLIASQIGIPGLLLFLSFLWCILRASIRAASDEETFVVAVALGTAAALVAVIVHSQFDIIATHTNLTLLWLFAGLTAALGDRAVANRRRLMPVVANPGSRL